MKEIGGTVLIAVPALFSPIITLCGIFSGIATPTAAPGLAVLYTLIVSTFIHREMPLKRLPRRIARAGLTTGTILLIATTASIATYIFTIDRLPETVTTTILPFSTNPQIVILLMGIVCLVIGMFMDIIAAIPIVTPILFPTAVAVGIDPIDFVVFMVCAFSVGLSTPPVGVCPFATSLVARLPIEEVVTAAVPYYLVLVVFVILIALFPVMSLWPVKLLGM